MPSFFLSPSQLSYSAAEKAYAAAVSSADVRKQIEIQSAIKFNGGGECCDRAQTDPLLQKVEGKEGGDRMRGKEELATHSLLHQGRAKSQTSSHSRWTEGDKDLCHQDAYTASSGLSAHSSGHINHSLFWKNLAGSKNGGGQLNDGE